MTGTTRDGQPSDDATDEAAQIGVMRMAAELSREARWVRDRIVSIEEQATEVESPSLKEAAAKRVNELRIVLYQIVAKATHDRYTAEDVQGWAMNGMSRGARFPSFDTNAIKALALIQKVPNAALREGVIRFVEAGGSYVDIVTTAHERLVAMERETGEQYGSGAWGGCVKDAVKSLQTQLGMRVEEKRGNKLCTFLMRYEQAVAVSQAIGMNPLQAGV